jgi:predicted DNA-binding transcriptional regulator YafY
MDTVPERHETLSQALSIINSLSGSVAGLTVRELMAEHGLGLRTVQRMLRAIDRSCHTLELVDTERREKRWRMRSGAVSHSIGIKADEIVEIEAAARRLSEEGLNERASALRRAGAKLRTLSADVAVRRAEPDAEVILSSEGLAARPGPRVALSSEMISTLRGGILALRCLKIEYRSPDMSIRRHIVEPYGILYGMRPYLVAAVSGKSSVVYWRLDRITSLSASEKSFLPNPDINLAHVTENSFAVWREEPFQVIIRFNTKGAPDARAWHFHRSQKVVELADGRLEVSFMAGGLVEMVNHFSQWGDTIEVVQPDLLRERLCQHGMMLVATHGKGDTKNVQQI